MVRFQMTIENINIPWQSYSEK